MDVWVAGPVRRGRAETALRAGVGLASAAAGAIHIGVVPAHLREYWLFGLFFVAAGAAQAGWAFLMAARPTRALNLAGLVGNAAVVALWIVSRTLGVPVGPEPGVAEPVGVLDALSSAFEVLIVIGTIALLRSGQRASLERAKPVS